MELEIECYKCKLCFDIDLKDDDGENEILIHCEICKKPNQVNYNIQNGKLITIKISNGKDLEDSQWVDPFKTTEYLNFQKRNKEAKEEKKRILIKRNGKWFFKEFIEIKEDIKSVFNYWENHPPLNKHDERFRNHIKIEWKYILNQDEYLFSIYDGEYEDILQDKLDGRIEHLKTDYLKFYNFDGSLDLELISGDNPNQ